jgi:hypothetical protein
MTPEYWMSLHFKKPFVIFDFQYHPEADWWIDHHGSAFRLAGDEYEKKFNNNDQHYLSSDAPSGAGLVKTFLENKHEFKSNDIIKKLVAFTDIEDSANYPTLEAKLNYNNPYKQVMLLLEDPKLTQKDDAYYKLREQLVRNVAMRSIEDIVGQNKEDINRIKKHIEHLEYEMQKRAQLNGQVVVIDATDMPQVGDKNVGLLKYPKARFTALAYGHEGAYHIRIIWNNWAKNRPTLHMAETARIVHKGAGGHPGIGAVSVKTKQEALGTLQKLSNYIDEQG